MSIVEGWTEARLFSFIRSALRSAWNKFPNKFKALHEAKRKSLRNDKSKWEYECKVCNDFFLQKDVCVDHIHPCGKLNSFSDISAFTENLFCSVDNLQVVCKDCHSIKTYSERMNISFKEAKIMKMVLEALKKPVKAQIEELRVMGYPKEKTSNTALRRASYAQYYAKAEEGDSCDK